MKELHARVEAGLAQAKAVLENPNSSQEEVDAQVQVMKDLTEEVNKVLAGGLTSPAQLGEGGSATPSEASPTPRRGRGRREQLTPPAMPAPAENQETKETAEEVTDYTNGQGSYPLSEKIHNLLQELKTSTENPEQVQKLKEAYDKLNEALGKSENGLVNQEVFNAALEEYKKAAQLKNGVEKTGRTRNRRSVSGLVYGFATGSNGNEKRARDSSGRERDARSLFNGQNLDTLPLKYIATVETGTIRDISLSGFPMVDKNGKPWATITKRIDNNGKRAVLTITGRSPKDIHGVYNTTLTVTEGNGHVSSKIQAVQYQLPKPEFDESPLHPGKTAQEDVEGKAGEKPIVKGKIPTPPGGLSASNIPKGSQLRMYLVQGGHNDSFDGIETSAKGYDIVAWGLVGADGTSVLYPTQYKKQSIGDKPLRLIVAYVHQGTDRLVSEDLVSPLSKDSITPTHPIDRDGANGELDTAAGDKKTAIEKTPNLTAEEIADAKRQVDEALADAKRKVGEAKDQAGVNRAKQEALSRMDQVLAEAIAKANSRTLSSQDKDQTPPRRARRSVGIVGNSQTGTTPSAVDKSELRTLIEDLERRLQNLAGLSPEALEEAQRILREAQAALANENLTAQELADLLAKVRQSLNSLQAGTSADKSQSASSLNKEVESAKESKNAIEVPLYGVFGAAVLSLLGALLFAVARKKYSQLDKLSRELNQLVVELEASNKDKKVLNKAKKLADEARLFVDSQQKNPQKEAELISEIKTVLSQLKEEV